MKMVSYERIFRVFLSVGFATAVTLIVMTVLSPHNVEQILVFGLGAFAVNLFYVLILSDGD